MANYSIIVLLLTLLSLDGHSAESPQPPKTISETPVLSEHKTSSDDPLAATSVLKPTPPKSSDQRFSVGVKGQSQQAINELDRSHVENERGDHDRDELELDEALDDWADDDGAELDDEHHEEANDEH